MPLEVVDVLVDLPWKYSAADNCGEVWFDFSAKPVAITVIWISFWKASLMKNILLQKYILLTADRQFILIYLLLNNIFIFILVGYNGRAF